MSKENPYMAVTISGITSSRAVPVSNGGTGNASLPSGAVLVGQGENPIVGVTGSDGQVLTWSDAEGGVIFADAVTGSGGGLSTVVTDGNLEGDGSELSPVILKDDPTPEPPKILSPPLPPN